MAAAASVQRISIRAQAVKITRKTRKIQLGPNLRSRFVFAVNSSVSICLTADVVGWAPLRQQSNQRGLNRGASSRLGRIAT